MKIHKKTDLPARDGKEEFSLTVLTCDKRGITNLGYYNFDTEDWGFFMDLSTGRTDEKVFDRIIQCRR